MYEFKLPDVGEGIHEAEIANWLVKEGDSIALDQPMLEIQTDKALVEIPSPVAGTIASINVQNGQMAQVGDLLVTIQDDSTSSVELPSEVQQSVSTATPDPTTTTIGIAGPGQRVLAAPAVRRLAREHGIDLSQLSGSGDSGRVLLSDIKQAIEAKTSAPPTPEPAPPVP
ncbi:biotin/lipoyl-containing protein, partial [Anaerolineales bacterium HSG6]|nr:biotin/lipoyl-containing protein [Anaerolineales bacterium HSG6]